LTQLQTRAAETAAQMEKHVQQAAQSVQSGVQQGIQYGQQKIDQAYDHGYREMRRYGDEVERNATHYRRRADEFISDRESQ